MATAQSSNGPTSSKEPAGQQTPPEPSNSAEFEDTFWGERLFQLRDFTPIPIIALALFLAKPTVLSATIGTLVIGFGEFFRVYSVSFIGSISRTRKDRTGGNLITKGPFQYVRNPLYVGNFLIVVGLIFYCANIWLALVTIPLFIFQYYHIVRYEESFLVRTFGETYKEYRRRVPAWIPMESPQFFDDLPKGEVIRKAIKSERRTLLSLVVLLALLSYFSS